MTTLLLKDLRLSLDALRPWAMIVVGLLIGAMLAVQLPPSLDPWGLHNSKLTELVGYVGFLVGASAIAASAWIAAAIVQGDRRHGALALSHVLSSRPAQRAKSKVLAIVAVALVPPLVAEALRLADQNPTPAVGAPGWVVLAGSAVGAAIALLVASRVRGAFQAVAITLLVGLVAATIGGLAGWVTFDSMTAGLVSGIGYSHEVPAELLQRENLVTWLAASAGLGAAALVCGALGARSVARTPARREVLVGLGVGAAAACLAGWLVAIPNSRFEPSSALMIAHRAHELSLVDEDRIVAAITRWYSNNVLGTEDGELLREGLRRAEEGASDGRGSRRIAETLRSFEDFSTQQSSARSMSLIPLSDPRGLALALEGIERFPDAPTFRLWALQRLYVLQRAPLDMTNVDGKLLRELKKMLNRWPGIDDATLPRAQDVIPLLEKERASIPALEEPK